MRRAIVAIVVSALVLVLGAWSARLVLPACGVNSPWPQWLAFCPAPVVITDQSALDDLLAERRSLEQRIARLQDQLTALRCAPPASPPPPQAERITQEDWDNRDLDLLEGCWELDSDYRTEDPSTGTITQYDQWTVCFPEGSNGQGRQVMRSTDGATCEGTVTSEFNSQGQLIITEPEDVPCSDGYRIYRRIATCALARDGTLQCGSLQPEVNGRGSYNMRPRT